MNSVKRQQNKTDEIIKTVCDGKIITGVKGLTFHSKTLATAYAETPATIDVFTAYNALNNAIKRVKCDCNIDLFLSPAPAEAEKITDNYEEAAKVIIKAINKAFFVKNFRAKETAAGITFEFELYIPDGYKKSNAELLKELNKQFKKLSISLTICATIIRYSAQKSD